MNIIPSSHHHACHHHLLIDFFGLGEAHESCTMFVCYDDTIVIVSTAAMREYMKFRSHNALDLQNKFVVMQNLKT